MFCERVCKDTWEDPSLILMTKINHVLYASEPLHMLFLLPILSSVALHLPPLSSVYWINFFFQNAFQASFFLNICLRTEWLVSLSLLLLHSVPIIILDSVSTSTLQAHWGQTPNLFLQHHLLLCPAQKISISADQLSRPGEGRKGMSPLGVEHQDLWWGQGLKTWH